MKRFPDFMLREKRSNYYLLEISQFYYCFDFNKQLIEFSNYLSGNELTIESIGLEYYRDKCPPQYIKINTKKPMAHEDINNIYLIYLMVDYYIYDNTNKWEFFGSETQEIAVLGCDDDVKSNFEEIFQPYKEQSLVDKLKWLPIFNDEKYKQEYIATLCKNYGWKI
ncbi:MAG: hypothetical protein AB7V36_06315 [Bacteroidales bacterium]